MTFCLNLPLSTPPGALRMAWKRCGVFGKSCNEFRLTGGLKDRKRKLSLIHDLELHGNRQKRRGLMGGESKGEGKNFGCAG